jgi:hypothetical protein
LVFQQAVKIDCRARQIIAALKHPCCCIMGDMSDRLTPALHLLFDSLESSAGTGTDTEKLACYDKMQQTLQEVGFDKNQTARCDIHGECKVFTWGDDGDGRKWKLMLAGTTCKDVSIRNQHFKRGRPTLAGRSARPFWIWIHEVLLMLPDVVIHEITSDGGVDDILKDTLGKFYNMTSDRRVCPSRLGYPVHRKRRMTILWKKELHNVHRLMAGVLEDLRT